MKAKGVSVEVLGRNEEHATKNQRKGDPCYDMTENVAKLCSSVLWKSELLRDDIGIFS